ncbi:hypothetical protein TNCV_67571 [Trichonephila clavipes]|nr:hypothetical protein TNCV_67571 [Trichonephila clavipes]
MTDMPGSSLFPTNTGRVGNGEQGHPREDASHSYHRNLWLMWPHITHERTNCKAVKYLLCLAIKDKRRSILIIGALNDLAHAFSQWIRYLETVFIC